MAAAVIKNMAQSSGLQLKSFAPNCQAAATRNCNTYANISNVFSFLVPHADKKLFKYLGHGTAV